MKHLPDPDRLASKALKTVLALNAFAFLSFLTVIAGAYHARADVAQPNIAQCATGHDLLAELVQKDPATVANLRQAVAETPNHSGLFWKVEKDGIAPSYLFGTIHLSDPRVTKLSADAQKAYDQAETVIVEAIDILDPKTALKIRVEHPDLMQFTDGTTLTSLLPQDQLEQVRTQLEKRGIVLAAVNKMKPWMLSGLLSLPRCELLRKQMGADFLDQRLARQAQTDGKNLKGLETSVEQLNAMNRLPLAFHIRNLLASLSIADQMEDVMETTISLYRKGEIGMIVPAMRVITPDELADDDYEQFQKVMVIDRNHTMADRSAPLFERGNAFMAIGALHLPGEEGVIELLKRKGFRVSRVNS